MKSPRHRVTCAQFTSAILPSLDAARRRLRQIEGTADCLLKHTIEVEQRDGSWKELTDDGA